MKNWCVKRAIEKREETNQRAFAVVREDCVSSNEGKDKE